MLRSSVPYISGAVNLRAATGGVDAETVAEAKVRGPLTLRTGQRAVTAGDFERLTLESSIEVARARCLPSATGRGPVRLLVVPQVRTDPRQHVAGRLRAGRAADAQDHRTSGRAPRRRHRGGSGNTLLPGGFGGRPAARTTRPAGRAGPAARSGRTHPVHPPADRRRRWVRLALRRRSQRRRHRSAAGGGGGRQPGGRGAAVRVRPAHRATARRRGGT